MYDLKIAPAGSGTEAPVEVEVPVPRGPTAEAAGSPTTEPELSFQSSVDRKLVHRAAISEVFVTDSAPVGDGEFMVAGQLPRGHAMIDSPQHDFNLLLEFVRQAGVLITHRYFDVPCDDSAFLFRRLDVQIDPRALRIGVAPAECRVAISATARRNRAGRVTEVTFSDDMRIGGRSVLTGNGSLMVMTRSSWSAVRKRGRAQVIGEDAPIVLRQAGAVPAVVGRIDPRNVMITTPRFLTDEVSLARLRVDLDHAYMFDHALDHLPGNLILEGARQAAVATVAMAHGIDPFSLTVHGCVGDFAAFGELDLATTVTTRASALRYDNAARAALCPVRVEVAQAGRVITTVELTIGAAE